MSQIGDTEATARFDEFMRHLDASPVPPGASLADDLLYPKLLARNMRANLFPREQARIVLTLRNALVRNAARQILFIEETHAAACPRPLLHTIAIVPHRMAAASATTTSASSTNAAAAGPAINTATTHAPAIPFNGGEPTSDTKLYEFLAPGSELVGSEEWTIERCGTAQQYRVNYFKRDDDEFFSEVAPTNASGFKDMLLSKLRRFVFM